MAYVVSTAPAAEPVLLAEAKLHLRVEHVDDDALIDVLIQAAREHVENHIKRPLITQVIDLTLDCFPSEICINRQPVQTVDAINYVDGDGVSQVVLPADYDVDVSSEPARITPSYGNSWPSIRAQNNAVSIEFTAGYGLTGAAVPAPIRQAMLLLISHWYENREAVVIGTISSTLPMAVDALLSVYKVHEF